MTCNSIKIIKGNDGYDGPLMIIPAGRKHEFIYITGDGEELAIVDKIIELTGAGTVNGFKTLTPDDEVASAIIGCRGTLRCGIYPKKETPTINVVPTGESGPLAQYINETIYVSTVDPRQITLASGEAAADTEKPTSRKTEFKCDTSEKITEQEAEQQNFVAKIDMGTGKVVTTLNQSAYEGVQTMINVVTPLMAFVSLLIGMIQGSGIGEFFANIMAPLAGSIVGLTIIGFTCSLPFLFPLLGSGAVISQVIDALIGVEVGKGNTPPQLTLPASLTIDIQNAYDFILMGLGLEEAEAETVEIGISSVLYSRFLDGAPRILVAWLASLGLYS